MSATDTQPDSAASFRIWTCGAFRVERRVGESYQPIGIAEWGGSTYPRLLLKGLLCCPGRRARRDSLQKMLWRDADPEQAVQFLNRATSKLRSVLQPDRSQASLLLTSEEASHYRLADQAHVWVDADAALMLLAQAEHRSSTGEDALALLEEAAQYFADGPFLDGDDGVWLYGRRSSIDIARHRCLLWMAMLYEQRGWLQKAQDVLLTAWQADMSDEDVLCRAMSLLHRQGMTSQAFKLYKRTTEYLAQDELAPTETTRALAERLHSEVRPIELQTSVLSTHALYVPATYGILLPSSMDMHPSLLEIASIDCATWFGYKQAQILAWIDTVIGNDVPIVEFQRTLDQEFKMLDEAKLLYHSDEYTLSRRQALIALAMLPLGRLVKAQPGRWQEEVLFHCATSITACWHLMQGREFAVIEEILSAYLPFLVSQVQQSSFNRSSAAGLASQAYRLKGTVALHRKNLSARKHYCQKAVYYSEMAEELGLHVAALISLASTYYYSQSPAKAASIYKQALPYQKSIPRLQQSRLYAELAVVVAQEGQEHEALIYVERGREVYPEHPERDPSFLYAEFSPASMILEEGLAYLALSSHFPTNGYDKQAWRTFGQIELVQEKGNIPERIRYEIINHQAETALTLRDQEAFEAYLKQGIKGARLLNSQQRRQEIADIYKKARETVWPNETRIESFAELFL